MTRRIAVLPARIDDNPYLPEVVRALRARGIDVVEADRLDLRWSVSTGRHLDAVHLHWLEYLVQTRQGQGLRGLASVTARAVQHVAALLALRLAGTRVVWTAHNLRPHRQRYPRVDAVLASATLRLADACIVHTEDAARRLRERHPHVARRIAVVPHPTYAGAYGEPGDVPKDAARRELGLRVDGVVALAFGRIRADKNVPDVIDAFRRVEAPHARLVVAGAPEDEAIAAEVRRHAAGDERVTLRMGFAEAGEVGTLHAAADVAPFFYDDLSSSGALALARTWGLDVVTRAPGSDGVAELHAALTAPGSSDRHLQARAPEASWDDMARTVIELAA